MITGASSGIGGALAVELAKRGARLGLVARRAEALAGVAQSIAANGGLAFVLPADVRNADSLRQAAEQLRGQVGQVDVLIANAGIGPTRDASGLDPTEVSD